MLTALRPLPRLCALSRGRQGSTYHTGAHCSGTTRANVTTAPYITPPAATVDSRQRAREASRGGQRTPACNALQFRLWPPGAFSFTSPLIPASEQRARVVQSEYGVRRADLRRLAQRLWPSVRTHLERAVRSKSPWQREESCTRPLSCEAVRPGFLASLVDLSTTSVDTRELDVSRMELEMSAASAAGDMD